MQGARVSIEKAKLGNFRTRGRLLLGQTTTPLTSQTHAGTLEFARFSVGISGDGRWFCDFI